MRKLRILFVLVHCLVIKECSCYFIVDILLASGEYQEFACRDSFTVTGERGIVNIGLLDNNPNIDVEPKECHCLIYPGSGTWINDIIYLEYGSADFFITQVTYGANSIMNDFEAVPFILNMDDLGYSYLHYLDNFGAARYVSLLTGATYFYRFNPIFEADISCSPHEFYRPGYPLNSSTTTPTSTTPTSTTSTKPISTSTTSTTTASTTRSTFNQPLEPTDTDEISTTTTSNKGPEPSVQSDPESKATNDGNGKNESLGVGAIIGIVIGVAMLCLVVGVIIGFVIKGKPKFCRKASTSQNKGSTGQGVSYYNTETSPHTNIANTENSPHSNIENTENGSYINIGSNVDGLYIEIDDVNTNDRAYANANQYESIPDQSGGATYGKDYVNTEQNEDKEYGAIWDANIANA